MVNGLFLPAAQCTQGELCGFTANVTIAGETFSRLSDVLNVSQMLRSCEVVMESAVGRQDQDADLVGKAREGSHAAFDALFHRHKQFVYNVCYRMLGSADDAVDVTQTAFIQAYRELRRFRGEASLRSWLYRIAVNQCMTLIRREQRRRRLAEAMPPPATRTEDDLVWDVMLKLDPHHRAVLVLHYFQGLSCDETAEALGCSAGALRTRLFRARVAFKRIYEEIEK